MSPKGPVAPVAGVRLLGGRTAELLHGRDLAAAAAAATYFAAIGVVPWLLLALWSTSWGPGEDAALARLLDLRVLVPPDMGARPAFDLLVEAGTGLGWVGAVVVLLPASFYGEGLRRGGLALVPQSDRLTGWRARAALMPLVVLLPVLTWVLLAVADRLRPLAPEAGGGGAGDLLVRVLVGFTVLWLALTVPLAWVFRAVLPGTPMRWWVTLVGASLTAAHVAGFLHGFQLFLAIPVDVGIPFGGLGVVGGVVAVGLWLYVLHTILLVGWVVTRAADSLLDDRAAVS